MVTTWGADEGLPQSSAMDMAQTPDGYLWIATLMGGISRFDGVRFVNFDLESTQGHGPTTVNHLFTDSSGRLWVNAHSGLDRYDEGRFISEVRQDLRIESLLESSPNGVLFATTPSQLLCGTADANGNWLWKFIWLSNSVLNPQCTMDAKGTVWYLRSDGALGRWKDGAFDSVTLGAKFAGHKPTALTADDQGRIWVGTDQGIALWDKDRFVSMTPTNNELEFSVKRIIPARNGSLWVVASGKLRRCVGLQWAAEATELEAIPNWWRLERSAKEDGQGGLWLILQGWGLAHVDVAGRVQRVSTADGLPSNLLRTTFLDREGNLWTGYDRGGLVRIRPSLFQTISKADGLADAVVSSVCEDRDGTIWIGTVGGTLGRWRDGQCTNFTLPRKGSLCQNLVVCPDAGGRLWIGSEGNGVLVYEHGEFKRMMEERGQGSVRMILADHAGRIWVGTVSTLSYYQNGKWTLVRKVDHAADFLAAIAETSDGTIWLGTDGGKLLRYNGSGFDPLQPPLEFQPSRFWTIWPEADGSLWIGTYGNGLLRFQGGQFQSYISHQDMGWNRISELLDDGDGNLWLGTGSGIERVAKSALEDFGKEEFRPMQRRLYGRGDGLLTIGTSVEYQPCCWKGRDGRLWFGTANGVASVDPHSVPRDTVPPVMVMEEVRVDGRVLPEDSWRNQLTKPAGKSTLENSTSGSVTIAPGQHDLELRFTAPSMVAPETVRIHYRLAGLEENWSEPGTDRSVQYRALPPGRYTFQARAWNCDDVPTQSDATLAITVLPYFWQTRWFAPLMMLGLVALTGASVALVMRLRHRKRLARLELRRAREAERARISQDLHDDLGASLTEISMLATPRIASPSLPVQFSGRLKAIADKARETIHALDEIVWAVDPRHDSLAALVDYLG